MADNSNTILNKLQQYKMQPPADAFEKAWERCMHETPEETADRKAFGQLKDHGLQAPQLDLKKIMIGEKAVAEKKKPFVISISWRRAAVVLLLIAAGAVVYVTIFNKKETGESYAAGEKIKNTPVAKENDSNTVATIAAGDAAINGLENTAAANNQGSNTVAAVKGGNKKSNAGGVLYAGNENSFTSNDVFFTLINYKENGRDNLFYKTLSAKKITLNQYSYINLSDKMVAMLQDLYVTKRNGKMARKAKKAKKKFDRWRKKEEKYFDKKLDKNPADIIDLSDFLMHN
ncbi:MAG: hypothetical protein V4685_00725 [Bacteroidota bacterium]